MKKGLCLFLACLMILMTGIGVFAIEDDYSEDIETITTGVEPGVPFTITAKAALLMEKNTGEVIISKNGNEHLPMASVTKVMTLLLAMEAIDAELLSLDSVVTVSEFAAGMGGSQAYLEPGEQMSLHDILKCVVVSSCNDAAVALAEKISGNMETFVARMNERAKELEMKDTHFVNCTGLDADNHYSCAHDIAVMSRELMKHPLIFDYTKIWMDTVRNGEFGLSNTNKLLKAYSGITGLKTGSTNNALYCITATAEREGTEFISVILGAPSSKDRFQDAAKLLDYGFSAYQSVHYTEPEMPSIPVKGGKAGCVAVSPEIADVSVLVKRGSKESISSAVTVETELKAPIAKGQKVGEIQYKLGDKVIQTSPILATEDVEKLTFFDYLYRILMMYFMAK